MQAKVGTFTTNASTGNQAISGVGFQPKFVYFWTSVDHTDATLDTTNGHTWSFGAATSTTNRFAGTGHSDRGANDTSRRHTNDECIQSYRPATGSVQCEADFVSFDSDGFTINIGVATLQITVHYLAMDCDAYIWGQQHSSTGTLNLTGAGFAPNVALFFSGHRSAWDANGAGNIGNYGFAAGVPNSSTVDYQLAISGINRESSNNNRTESDDALIGVSKTFGSSGIIYASAVTAWGSDGLSLNVSNSSTAYQIVIGLKVPAHSVGTTLSPTSAGEVDVDGGDIGAKAALFFGTHATDDDHTNNSFQLAMFGGLGDDDTQAVKAWLEHSGSNHSMQYDDVSACVVNIDSAGETIQALADGTMNPDGFTLDYSSAVATQYMTSYLLMGDQVVYPDPVAAAWSPVAVGAAIVARMVSPYPTNDIPRVTWSTVGVPTNVSVDAVTATWSTVEPDVTIGTSTDPLTATFGFASPVTVTITANLDTTSATWATVDFEVGAPIVVDADPVTATWSTVALTSTLAASVDPVTATWATVTPTASLQAIADAVSASWSTVAVTHSWVTQPDSVSATWSTVDPDSSLQASLDSVSASWSTTDVDVGLGVPVVTATWATVDVELVITSNVDPVSATWATVAVSSVLGASMTPVTATWTTVGVDAQIEVSGDVVVATWATVDPETSGGISVEAVGATWATVSPGLQLGVGVVTATWTTVTPTAASIHDVDEVTVTWATVDPLPLLVVSIDEALEATWTVLGIEFSGPSTTPQPITGFICQPVVQVFGGEATVQTFHPGPEEVQIYSERPPTQSCIGTNPGEES